MLTTLLILTSVTFIAMMSPGPDMMLIIKHSAARQRWPAFACILGICCGVLVHVSFSILGIAAAIAASAMLFTLMKIAGAIYLIYIGIQSLLSKGGFSQEILSATESKKVATPFRDGLLCNVLNPKVTLFILAIFTQFVEPSTAVFDKAVYGLFIVLEAFVVWNIFVSLVRTKFILQLLQRFSAGIDRFVGVVLIGFGGALLFDEAK